MKHANKSADSHNIRYPLYNFNPIKRLHESSVYLLRLLGGRGAAGLGRAAPLQLDLPLRRAHHLLPRLGHLLQALVLGPGGHNLRIYRVEVKIKIILQGGPSPWIFGLG